MSATKLNLQTEPEKLIESEAANRGKQRRQQKRKLVLIGTNWELEKGEDPQLAKGDQEERLTLVGQGDGGVCKGAQRSDFGQALLSRGEERCED